MEKRWGYCEYHTANQIQFTVWFKEKTGLESTLEYWQLAEMEVFVSFIYKMTLLVRIVGGSKLTPYDSNCSESECVCARVCARVHARWALWCLRERTSDGASGLRQGTAERWMRSEMQRANVKEEILLPTLLPLDQERPLRSLFQTLKCR